MLRLFKIFLLLFLTAPAFADIILPPPSNNLPIPSHYRYFSDNSYELFNWPARLSGWGLGGDYVVGMADGMLPLIGNDRMMLYTDFQGKYATQDWFAGAGLGLRAIYNNERIIGGYVFADRNEFTNPSNLTNTDFWFISPGLESLGNIWDFRVNGYIPVSSQQQRVGTTFADNLGNFDFVVFQFHQQYNHLFDVFNVTGYGADAEIGRVVPGLPNTRVYVGGYYFDPKDSNSIRGVEGRINIPFNHYVAFTAADSYDNTMHNSIEAGIKLTLGGIDDDVAKDNHDISRRMVDPISRNLATLSHGTAQPIKKITKDEGRLVLERDNIYFFTTTGGSVFNPANGTQNCTFENPCQAADFVQATIDSLNTIAPNTNFYLNSGTYNPGAITINNGQSIFGRTPNYVQSASGNGRPLLVSGTTFTALTLLGNNTIDSIRLTSGGGGDFALLGIEMNGATNVLISNSQIGDPATAGDFVSALLMSGGSQATVINSTLSANFPFLGGTNAVGVVDNSQLSIINSSVIAQNTFDTAASIGIVASGTSRVNVIDSSITAVNTVAGGAAIGIQSNDNAQVSVSGSTISATATTADALQQNGASTITVNNSRCFENGVEVACTP